MTMSVWLGGNGDTTITQVGLFVKLAAMPSRPIALLDMDAGAAGAFRIYWDVPGPLGGGGGPTAEYSYGGHICASAFGVSGNLVPGAWLWLAANFGGMSTGGAGFKAQVTGPAGFTSGPGTQSMVCTTPGAYTALANFGWGVNFSGTYDDFPNAAGYEMAVCMATSATLYPQHADELGLLPVPTSDPSPSVPHLTYLYLCHQSVGAQSIITDASTNHFDLTAGPNGAAIMPVGPY